MQARAQKIAQSRTHGNLSTWGRRLVNNWLFNTGQRKKCVSVETTEETYTVHFEDVPESHTLLRYTLEDGITYTEKVQKKGYIGSNGDNYFYLCLEDETGSIVPESVWPEDEMRAMDQD